MCVVPGTVFIKGSDRLARFPTLDMRYQRPSGPKAESQLFCVNKQLRLEALEVFLSKNQFVVSGPHDIYRMYHDPIISPTPGTRQRDSLALRHLRSVSILLSSIEHAPSQIIEEYGGLRSAKARYRDFQDNSIDDGNIVVFHLFITLGIINRLAATVHTSFVRPGQLRKIEINLEATTCSSGCHRLVKELFGSSRVRGTEIVARRPHIRQIESVYFIGIASEKEVQAVHSAFPSPLSDKFTFHVFEPLVEEPFDSDHVDLNGQ